MKRTIFVLGLFIGTFGSILAQFELCESSISQDLYDVYFIDKDIGVAVGDSGAIIRSTDGGNTWITMMMNDTIDLKKVDFFNAATGLAVGTTLLKTIDQGQTWQEIFTGNTHLYDIEIINDSVGFISGYPTGLMKTQDRGENWEILVPTNINEEYGLLSFIDENIGYTICSGGVLTDHLLKTQDGGYHWDTIEVETGIDNTVLEAFSFIDADLGFRGGWYNGHFMKTIDGGINWNRVSSEDSLTQSVLYAQLYDFHIETNQPSAYYACGWYGKLFKSSDGGDTWYELDSPVEDIISLYGIYFLDEDRGWAVGAEGKILKTINGGLVTNVETSDSQIQVEVYPNPVTEKLYIYNVKGDKLKSIRIYDQLGREVLDLNPTWEIDLSFLQRGVYYLQLRTNKGEYVEKILKE